MSTTTGLNINTLNVNYSDCISWNNTSLIKIETKLFFGGFLILKIFADWVTFKNNLVGLVLDLHFLFFADGFIMSDINMSIVLSFFSTVLPNVWTKDSSSGSIHNMSASVKTN